MDGDLLRCREAGPADVDTILRLILALADFENLSDQVEAQRHDLEAHLFGERRYAEALIVELDGDAVGYALFFHTYSTFLAKPGLYLEDLFVVPEARGRGAGRALLESVARRAVERGCGRLEWSVLDWNERAIAFYRSLGGEPVDGWTTYRVTGAGLQQLGRAK
jgi:GNAT superfamily N-acetyltransferase